MKIQDVRYIIDLRNKKLYYIERKDVFTYKYKYSVFYKVHTDFNEAKKELQNIINGDIEQATNLLNLAECQKIDTLENLTKIKQDRTAKYIQSEKERINSIIGLNKTELLKALDFALNDVIGQDRQANLKTLSYEDYFKKYNLKFLTRKDFLNNQDFRENAIFVNVRGDLEAIHRQAVIEALQKIKQEYQLELKIRY